MFTLNDTIVRLEELMANGLDLKKARAYLIIEDYQNGLIEKAIKYLDLKAAKANGFKAEFFNWLAEAPRTKFEATDYIMGNGDFGETSDNVKKSLSTNINIWELTSRIWSGKGEATPEPEVEEESFEEPTGKDKAWDEIKKAQAAWAKGKKPRKNSFHPDKVAKYGDEFLTKAYNDFQAEMNNAA